MGVVGGTRGLDQRVGRGFMSMDIFGKPGGPYKIQT